MLNRRSFVKASLVPAALAITTGRGERAAQGAAAQPADDGAGLQIIDTNVHLFPWPFRVLKYDRTEALARKLRGHRIAQGWAGSFEAVLHKQLDAANRRLADECRDRGAGLFIPFGSVNPAWPDWEEDLRRCHEQYRMPGIRLYPAYHGYGLGHPEFLKLVDASARRGLIVQIAIRLEDERVHLASLVAPAVDAAPLVDVLLKVPEARVQLLNADTVFRGRHARTLAERTATTFDIAAAEGNGGISRLLDGTQPSYRSSIPVERLLFGSHAPFFPCESALLKLFESPLDRPQLDQVMHANARRLLAGTAATPRPSEREPGTKPNPDPRAFALNAARYGLPTRDDLVALRIWDIHYHGLTDGNLRQHEQTMFYVERMGIERVLSLDIAGTSHDPLGRSIPAEKTRTLRKYLEDHAGRVSGLIPIDPGQPEASCQKMEEWIKNGPCVGIKYYGGNPQGLTCSHPNNDAIIKLAAELQALIYIHAWMHVGGTPRRPGGGNVPGESTPLDVALLAERFPDVPIICGHSGGDWELGVRAVRRRPNVLIEFSGSDPHSGQVDYTVAQVGADRMVWGGHGPSRSYSTELSKVLDANLSDAQRRQILGGNLRRLAAPIFRRKGYPIDP